MRGETMDERAGRGRRLWETVKSFAAKQAQWSKILTLWVLALNSYVIYHAIHLCYMMLAAGTNYSFGWMSTLVSVVVGLGNVVVSAYLVKSGKENVEKIRCGSTNENYP